MTNRPWSHLVRPSQEALDSTMCHWTSSQIFLSPFCKVENIYYDLWRARPGYEKVLPSWGYLVKVQFVLSFARISTFPSGILRYEDVFGVVHKNSWISLTESRGFRVLGKSNPSLNLNTTRKLAHLALLGPLTTLCHHKSLSISLHGTMVTAWPFQVHQAAEIPRHGLWDDCCHI